ncbi:putative starch synthase [Helianthus debilis subsp. tardiflorus]
MVYMTSRKFVVNGITNGIDVTEWDPSSDEHHYTADDLVVIVPFMTCGMCSCDILLMPSRFKPCGLNQLYGTVPVVYGTGGLGMGLLAVDKRMHVGKHKASWEGLMRRGMERDCSWDNVALEYEQVFQWNLDWSMVVDGCS